MVDRGSRSPSVVGVVEERLGCCGEERLSRVAPASCGVRRWKRQEVYGKCYEGREIRLFILIYLQDILIDMTSNWTSASRTLAIHCRKEPK